MYILPIIHTEKYNYPDIIDKWQETKYVLVSVSGEWFMITK